MLHDRIEDLDGAQAASLRYLFAAVTKNTAQSTLSALEKYGQQGPTYQRFAIRCAINAVLTMRSEERATLAAKLVAAALERPNALTLLATAMDDEATVTRESLLTLMAADLRLNALQQVQLCMALQLGNSTSARAAATTFLEEFSLPPAAAKEEDGNARMTALFSLQMGAFPDLDAQLAPLGGVSTFPQSTSGTGHVSVAGVLRELGTGCVTTLADSREFLSIFPYKFAEKDVAEALGFFASQGTAANDTVTYTSLMTACGKTPSKNASGSSSLVNAMPLLDALNEGNSFDWDNIVRLLDQPSEEAFRIKNISVIFDAYHKFKSGTEYPPVGLFLGRWGNTRRQKVMLEYIIKHPDKVNRKALVADAPAELLPPTRPASISAAELELWRYFPFVEAAVHIASREKDFDNDVLRPAAEKLPLLFLFTLFLGTYTGTIKNFAVIKFLLQSYCPPLDRVATLVIPEADKRGCLDSIISLFSELTVTSPARTLDVLEMVLKCKPVIKRFLKGSGSSRLVVAIAICMDEAGEPSDKWLQRALEGKLHLRTSSTENRFSVAMSVVEVAEMLLEKQLYAPSANAALNTLLASPLKGMLKSVMDCARVLLASTDSLFPEDVEAEATELFKKMYTDGNTRGAVETISRLIKSSAPRDKQLYACVVNILFDEGSAISCYPRKELQLFSELYGEMIAKELLPQSQQQRAWGQLLPAIAKPTNMAMEEYGIIALEQIKGRLADWPQYGRALRHIKDLDFKVPGVMAAINRGMKEERDGDDAGAPTAADDLSALPVQDPAILSAAPKKAASPVANQDQLHTLDIGTLITHRSITAPPRVIQEQINFLIGNTDVNNIDSNSRELSQLLRPEYYEYFADYIVVKRASLEPNYHKVYLDLIGKLNARDLDRALRTATTSAVLRLLASDKIRTDAGERKLLRNLGAWLGAITLERNVPILDTDISFKEILYRGARENKLIPVVSFITHVLSSCSKSSFFALPNPWTAAQVCLLLDMYMLPNIRITLRFEVELVCRNLGVTLADANRLYRESNPYYSTTYKTLADLVKDIDITDSLDFRIGETENANATQLMSSPPPAQQQPTPGSARPLQATAQPFQPKVQSPPARSQPSAPPANLDVPVRPPIVISEQSLRLAEDHAVLPPEAWDQYRKSLVPMLQSVVRDIYERYASRCVMVAILSSYSIIVKDFVRYSAYDEMLVAGEAMSRSLAANLSYTTVRDVIPEQLTKAVTALVESTNLSPEKRAALRAATIGGNEELCLRAIEYMAGEEAWKGLHKRLLDYVSSRANDPHRLPQDQIDMQSIIGMLGEGMMPSRGLLPPHQKAYTDFFNCLPVTSLFNTVLRSIEEAVSKHFNTEGCAPLTFATLQQEENKSDNVVFIRSRLMSLQQLVTPESAVYFLATLFNKLMGFTVDLELLKKEASNGSGQEETNRNARSIVTLLIQIYMVTLQTCVKQNEGPVREEFTRLYLRSDHRHSYSHLTADLLRIRILDLPLVDKDLAKALRANQSSCVSFASQMIELCIMKDKLMTTRDLPFTLTTLDSIARARNPHRTPTNAPPTPAQIVTPLLSKMVPDTVKQLVVPLQDATLYVKDDFAQTAGEQFDKWVEVYLHRSHRHGPGEERTSSQDYVRKLQDCNMLDNVNLPMFLGHCIRLCVEHYATVSLQMERERGEELLNLPTTGVRPGAPPPYRLPHSQNLLTKCDGFTDLVLLLLPSCLIRTDAKGKRDPSKEQNAGTMLLRHVLDVFTRMLVNHHDSITSKTTPRRELPAGAAYLPVFQQQPYVRIISNLMTIIQKQEAVSNSSDASEEVNVAFQRLLHRLQPLDYPAFSFGWLELVAHRLFIPRCMRSPNLWGRYTELLIDAIRFIEYLTPNYSVSPNGLVFYKAVFKLMLILLHDYPQFLISQHYPLCDAIPTYCVQMLNCVLSSFPPRQQLPEPFNHVPSDAPDMKRPIETAVQVEYIRATFDRYSKEGLNIPERIDQYIKSDAEPFPPRTLQAMLQLLSDSPRSLMNAVVLHIAITYLAAHDNAFNAADLVKSNAFALYRYLCNNFSTKSRYLFLCSCANHLRYPNIQTNFFAHVFFHLFPVDPASGCNAQTQTCIQEQITRVVGGRRR
ncbi:CCR4-NOT transcription complex subunit 1 [Strigomonas culicis]|uniref:CCR4-NOT transcription complex subunit 1 n=1 Tax=Strigomonas culicis TaxID=28005 RepID=S9UG41_9TRYP|nr:CCR4-NOT transcription complex subunit 1 [Strigomonas culicis]|eukprot:EPY27898.1 CCR4-NOT transcription complex subunit 1 [Strigomonas culicis]